MVTRLAWSIIGATADCCQTRADTGTFNAGDLFAVAALEYRTPVRLGMILLSKFAALARRMCVSRCDEQKNGEAFASPFRNQCNDILQLGRDIDLVDAMDDAVARADVG